MKKILFMFAMVVIACTANAQVEKGFRNGIQINGGMSNVLGDGDKFTIGYGLGWVAEFNFSPSFFIQSGVGIENIAHKEEAIDGTLNAFFAQIPIHVGYRVSTGETSAFFIQAGPTVGCGLFGSKIQWYGSRNETNYFDVAKRFDLGVGGRIGMEFHKFQISLGADYGVLDAFEGGGYHNFIANLRLAYIF